MANNTDLVTFEDLEAAMQKIKSVYKISKETTIEDVAIASFSDGADNIPLKDLKVNLAVNQPLHGQANPYPAGGGVNRWDEEWEVGAYASASGLKVSSNGRIRSKNKIPVTPSTVYYVVAPSGIGFQFYQYGSDEAFLRTLTVANNNTITTASDCYYITFNTGANTGETYGNNIAINYPSTVTTYSPFSNICPIYPVTEAEVSRTGKNLLNMVALVGGGTMNGDTYSWNSSTITRSFIQISPTPVTVFYSQSGYTAGSGTINARIDFCDADKTLISAIALGDTGRADGVCYIRFNYSSMSGGIPALVKPQIEIGSTATAYEAYKGQEYLVNIGINQWDEEWELGAIDQGTGENVAASNQIRSKNNIAVIPNTDYYIKSPYVTGLRFYGADGTYKGYLNNKQNSIATIPADAYFMRFVAVSTTSSADISINFPSRFTSYYPYTGRQVYGGELDVTTGVLTSRYAYVDLGSLTWTLSSNTYFFQSTDLMSKVLSPTDNYDITSAACSNYVADSTTRVFYGRVDKAFAIQTTPASSKGFLLIKDTAYTDAAAFKTAMAGVQLVYELASPITIQLDPTEVDTLRGDNVIWADCGDITNCEYRTTGLINIETLVDIIRQMKEY